MNIKTLNYVTYIQNLPRIVPVIETVQNTNVYRRKNRTKAQQKRRAKSKRK